MITADGLTEIFDILPGFLQGENLAPHLITIIINYCMSQALLKHPDAEFTIKPTQSRCVKTIKTSTTEFVYDISLLADSIQEV